MHTTDLDHPSRYLLPSEFVLTNGLWTDRVQATEWIGDLAAVGVVGLGFGLSEVHETVPTSVVSACRSTGVCLIEAPADLSFSSITEAVNSRLSGDAQAIRRQLARTRQLIVALTQGEGYLGLLRVLHRETSLAGAFVSPSGFVHAHVGAPPDEPALRAALAARRTQRMPRTLAPGLSAFAPPGHTSPPFMLVIGSAISRLSDEQRVLIEQIAAYATAEADGRRHALATKETLCRELLELALDGELSGTAYRARLRSLDLDPQFPVLIWASASSDFVRDAMQLARLRCATGTIDDVLFMLVQDLDHDAFVRWFSASVLEMDSTLAMGVGGSAVDADSLRAGAITARSALAVALRNPAGSRLAEQPRLDGAQMMRGFVPPGVADTFRRQVLGPLEAWDSAHGTDLMHTLRVFLEHNGRWREAARRLHIHHNTLKNRIDRIRQLTGRDAGQTADRSDLWLAMSASAPEVSGPGRDIPTPYSKS